MTPISCTPETPGWMLVQQSCRRRRAVRRALRWGFVLAVLAGATWYAVAHGAIYYL